MVGNSSPLFGESSWGLDLSFERTATLHGHTSSKIKVKIELLPPQSGFGLPADFFRGE